MRHGLLLVGLAPLGAQLVGSTFNIWYNLTQIRPFLSPTQWAIFLTAVNVTNLAVYPIAVGSWMWVVMRLRRPYGNMLHGRPVDGWTLLRARQRAINLPNWVAAFVACAWALCIPPLMLAFQVANDPLDARVLVHLPISVIIGGLMGVGHAYFAVELLGRKLLYPVLFQNARPNETPGAYPVSLAGRAVLCAVAAGLCPIVSLLLLIAVPGPAAEEGPWFAVGVGLVGIGFGIATAYMLARDVAAPIHELRRVAREVGRGNLDVRAGLQRADEFGELIDDTNDMVAGLREKQHVMETFGRHVGRRAARQILQRNPGLGGEERMITVLFADLRNFTARCSDCPPERSSSS